ncbi:MAG: hypothetical protein V8T45_00545 [Oscillospiraceae bacterium]
MKTGEESREIALEGLFVAIGHAPDLGAFGSLLELDESRPCRLRRGLPHQNSRGYSWPGTAGKRPCAS